MARLLHLSSSPRGGQSSTRKVAAAFLDAYRNTHPSDEVREIDLWSLCVPPFDGAVLDAKYAIFGGLGHTPEQHAAWGAVEALANEFKSADKILISVPMWNFGVPYVLKHYIDVITQPGLTFSFSPETGFTGLVTGRPATVIQSSAGTYLPGSGAEGADFLTGYLKLWLGFIGFTDIRSLSIAPTGTDPDTLAGIEGRAVNDAETSAHAF
jgi:FMN-dependent NADH-azoreductase